MLGSRAAANLELSNGKSLKGTLKGEPCGALNGRAFQGRGLNKKGLKENLRGRLGRKGSLKGRALGNSYGEKP